MTTVSERTSLVTPLDRDRIEATIDAQMAKCTQEQAVAFTAQLIAANPNFQTNKRTPEEERDHKIYVVKLAQAFMEIPYVVGLQAVHGGKGIPSKVAFRPTPADVLAFAKSAVERLQNVKSMMALHKREHERREKEKAEESKYQTTDPEARNARVQAAVAGAVKPLPRGGDGIEGFHCPYPKLALAFQHELNLLREKSFDQLTEASRALGMYGRDAARVVLVNQVPNADLQSLRERLAARTSWDGPATEEALKPGGSKFKLPSEFPAHLMDMEF